MAKKFKLIDTFVKIGRGVLLPESLEGILADSIIEKGLGFIKLKDGTFIQWGRYSGRVVSQIPWGPFQYYTVSGPIFPYHFVETPEVLQNPLGGGQLFMTIDYAASTASKIGDPRVLHPSIGRADVLWYSYFAIGRWK